MAILKNDELPQQNPISILLVEDDPEFRRAFEQMISTASDMRHIGSAENLADGLALLDRGPVNVLLVDLGLPDGNGLDIIREAVQRWPARCNVMVVSVFGDEEHVLSAFEEGATGYLLKDSSPTSFVRQIRELHLGGSPISPAIARKLLAKLPKPSANSAAVPLCGVPLAVSELTVLEYASRGVSYVETAKKMGITENTVKSYVRRCYDKLCVNSKMEALNEARRLGLVKK